jgi:hypothetical protein
LNYLGKYEKQFNGMDPEDLIEEIPEDSFLTQEVFRTDIVDKKYKDKFNRKKFFKQSYLNMDEDDEDDEDELKDYFDIEEKSNGKKNKVNNPIKI